MHESEPAVRVVFLRLEGMLEQVVGRGMARQARLPGVGDEPGLQHDLDGPFQRAHRVAQGEHAAVPVRTSSGWPSTSSRTAVPSMVLTRVSVDSGSPLPVSV